MLFYYLDEFIPIIVGSIVGLIVLIIIIRIISRAARSKSKGLLTSVNTDYGFMGIRGKTGEQKKVIKYFMSTGILSAIFKISNDAFDSILGNKVHEHGSQIEKRALTAHGMDADEVKEIPPIQVEGYSKESLYFKMFRDHTFRASEYQMSYLMFSGKQMYVYSHTFDLTSENTTEQTREYFYEDITNIDVTLKKIEFPDPRPIGYTIGGIAAIILGLISIFNGLVGIILGLCAIIAGIILMIFVGYSRSIVDNLVLKLTVPGDEFICAMNSGNMAAIQGMKAKIREKKK